MSLLLTKNFLEILSRGRDKGESLKKLKNFQTHVLLHELEFFHGLK